MPLTVPSDYLGLPLTESLLSFLPILERHSFSLVASGSAKKTIRVLRDGENRGYINGSVIQRQGVIGYHFAMHGRKADACPEAIEGRLVEYFCERYGCEPNALIVHKGSGANDGRTYLILRDPQVALQILLADSGETIEQEVHVTSLKGLYVEGRLVDVKMQRRERSGPARNACLAAYGFNCVICKSNLKSRYAGLPVEVIHVHHEEALSASEGEREFDPVETMKPVCPNCHAVIHSKIPPYSIEEVRKMVLSDTSL